MFEAREGWGWLLSPRKKIPEPPLAFEAREGVVVAVVTQKRMPEPLPRVWSEGGEYIVDTKWATAPNYTIGTPAHRYAPNWSAIHKCWWPSLRSYV
jgi:hypothetical protein